MALGLLHVHTWVREPGSLTQPKDTARPIEEKESVRWIDGFARVNALAEQLPETRLTYIADREADIYELFVEAPSPDAGADWLVRGQHDRVLGQDAEGNPEALRQRLAHAPVLTETGFDQPGGNGRTARTVHQQIKAGRLKLSAPYRRDRTLAEIEITAILATERQPPPGEDAVEWLLLTNLPVTTPEPALEILSGYLCRWQIAIFFRIPTSGCCIEALQLDKRERLEPALALYLIIAWRVLLLTMLGRACPEMPGDVVFDQAEWQGVSLVTQRQPPPEIPPSLDQMVRRVAGLGGFLNRNHDGFPGPQTIWIGLQRAADFVLAEAQRTADGGSCG